MRVNKIIFPFIMLLLIITSIAGAWDRYEINNHSLITLFGVDKQKDDVSLYLEYQPPHGKSSKTESSGKENSQFVMASGKSFAEAKTTAIKKIPDDVYLGSIRALVVSDNFAKYGIEEYLNRIRGIREYRKIQNIFTTSDELKKLFNSKDLETQNVGFDIEHLSEQLNINGIDYNSSISYIMESVNLKKAGFITNHIGIVDNKIANTGYSVFKDDKKIGFIEANKMSGVNYLIIEQAKSEFSLEFEDLTTTVEVFLRSNKITPEYKDGKIKFDIKMNFTSHLINTSKMIKIDNDKMKQLGTKISDRIKHDVLDAIKTSQKEFECDYLQFFKYFRAKYNSDFQDMDWNDKYKNAEINIDVKVEVAPSNLINYDF